MILITLKKWQNIQGITHIRTKWEVSDSETFTNIMESVESAEMLETYFSNIFIPVGSTYYVRATRIFNNGTTTELDPIATTNYGSDKSSILLQDDIYIDKPFVYVNKDDVLSNEAILTIKTSAFRCEGDDHSFTHWIIRDGTGEILYHNLYNKVDKTSITIPNQSVFKEKTKLEVIAIHGSTTGVESPMGKATINLTSDYNFEISPSVSWIEPLRDFDITFKVINPKYDMNIFKVELLDYATEALLGILERNGNNFMVPWYFLKENMKYKVGIYAYDVNLVYSKVIKEIYVASLTNTAIRNKDYIYTDRVDESTVNNDPNRILPNISIHTEVLYNNKILIPNEDKTCAEWISVGKNLTNTGNKAQGLLLPTSNYTNMLIKPLTKSLILIDMLDANNKPIFLLYTYNNHNDSYTLTHSKVRADETMPMGKTNAIVLGESTKLIYNPIGTNKLREYDITNNTITELAEIPIENLTKGIIINLNDGTLLIANGDDYHSKIYNISSKNYINGYNFGPASYIGQDLRTVSLINGDTAVIKLNKDTSDDPNIIYWDYDKHEFIRTGENVFNGSVPTLTTTCVDGHVHMSSTTPSGDPNILDTCELKVYY